MIDQKVSITVDLDQVLKGEKGELIRQAINVLYQIGKAIEETEKRRGIYYLTLKYAIPSITNPFTLFLVGVVAISFLSIGFYLANSFKIVRR
ncbi:MAG: hypothetical protein RMJ67_01170 [Elusimicrobiota bacterium]|nr:hypothetical protein [Endomicrobiia bacterium]MDW8165114.1 hypothetical protein [Elusimicrobiota bacterium]